MTSATDNFMAGLLRLAFEPIVLAGKPDHVMFDYPVETGQFAGRKVRLGLVVPPDFPATPPSGPHVSPCVRPICQPGIHPAGAIHPSDFGNDWQYWSRPFPNWATSKRTVAAYMSHIWQLWDSQ